ncbi:ethylene-responsive transcription factor ERF020-like [Pistacia vera]|uniref:ethylene-responsive transcription factor ERF020-like n=1 Tax=Pistacia vera TaxID=55513 RepID=UPI0012638765|nr:ethylene-responsive transcription factor ERF020-like [Pistacia vera]
MAEKKYKGVRRRKWGKWVSEIRVPGSQERLWLGSYATQEAAAVAHDVAFYCLRRPLSLSGLNFPELLPPSCVNANVMSPRSVQKAASDAGMGIDAQMKVSRSGKDVREVNESGVIQSMETPLWGNDNQSYDYRREKDLSISVEDYGLNFPEVLPSSCVNANIMSPKSVRKAASDAGMGIDAQMIGSRSGKDEREEKESGAIQSRGTPFGEVIIRVMIMGAVEDYSYRTVEDYSYLNY